MEFFPLKNIYMLSSNISIWYRGKKQIKNGNKFQVKLPSDKTIKTEIQRCRFCVLWAYSCWLRPLEAYRYLLDYRFKSSNTVTVVFSRGVSTFALSVTLHKNTKTTTRENQNPARINLSSRKINNYQNITFAVACNRTKIARDIPREKKNKNKNTPTNA